MKTVSVRRGNGHCSKQSAQLNVFVVVVAAIFYYLKKRWEEWLSIKYKWYSHMALWHMVQSQQSAASCNPINQSHKHKRIFILKHLIESGHFSYSLISVGLHFYIIHYSLLCFLISIFILLKTKNVQTEKERINTRSDI